MAMGQRSAGTEGIRSKDCFGEIRRDRRDRKESMQEEARREEEDIDSQRKRPIAA